MDQEKTASRKKPYSKPTLKLLDPQEVLFKINAAAEAGDGNAKVMRAHILALHRS